MDLAMVKQEQGETLRKYMHRFFDKHATVVDVTDKEVIDLFQDGLYHRRTFEDFGRHRPKSIPHLKDAAAAATTTGTKAVATTTTTTTTRVPTASASQTTLSRLSSALRRRTQRRTPTASKTC
jgi:hypothetical protein